MKKFFAVCLSLLLLIAVAVPCYAAPQREIVSETTTTLANGVECTTTVYWEPASARSSTRDGGVDQSYSYGGKTIGVVRLTATISGAVSIPVSLSLTCSPSGALS